MSSMYILKISVSVDKVEEFEIAIVELQKYLKSRGGVMAIHGHTVLWADSNILLKTYPSLRGLRPEEIVLTPKRFTFIIELITNDPQKLVHVANDVIKILRRLNMLFSIL